MITSNAAFKTYVREFGRHIESFNRLQERLQSKSFIQKLHFKKRRYDSFFAYNRYIETNILHSLQ